MKPRILFLSFTPPVPSWGSAMTFYRHFVERDDFDVQVVTDSKQTEDFVLPYTPVTFNAPPLWRRVRRTRLHKWVMGMEGLYGEHLLPRNIIRQAQTFRPDAVFTMAGTWNWVALGAAKVAKRLRVPLVASFNDWYDYPWLFGHELQRKSIERRFRRFYREADLALCTCDGMREALGEHPNVHIWYPMGASMPTGVDTYSPTVASAEKPATVLFSGSLGEWYGPMLEKLVNCAAESYPSLRFRICGSLQTWSSEFDQWARAKGIFLGRVPFEKLKEEAAAADLLLLPMGFGSACAHIERTSFKTKFLDYLSFRRPIIVWGPSYCSAVRVAAEFDSAEIVTTPAAEACAKSIDRLARDPQRRVMLIANARRMYDDRFQPERIYAGFHAKMLTTIKNFGHKKPRRF